MGKYDRPVWGGGAPLFGTGSAGYGTTWGATNTSPKPDMAGRGPRALKRADQTIFEDVCERLTDHPDVDASEVEVAVKEGEVTLTGSVPDRQSKWLAEDCALEVPGVREVHNRLRVQTVEPAVHTR